MRDDLTKVRLMIARLQDWFWTEEPGTTFAVRQLRDAAEHEPGRFNLLWVLAGLPDAQSNVLHNRAINGRMLAYCGQKLSVHEVQGYPLQEWAALLTLPAFAEWYATNRVDLSIGNCLDFATALTFTHNLQKAVANYRSRV